MKIARIYLRVSTDEQDVTRQAQIEDSARSAGYYLAGVCREKASGTAQADPLVAAAERHSWVRRFSPALIEAFLFRSARRHDPLPATIELLKQFNKDERRGLPSKVPIGHLMNRVRKIIGGDEKRKRRLWEIATLAVLRTRLRVGDVWAEGSRSCCPLEKQLMPSQAFVSRKEADDLGLGLPQDADAWIAEKQRELDFSEEVELPGTHGETHIGERIDADAINLTGIYDWNGESRAEGTFRPLRGAASEKVVEAA